MTDLSAISPTNDSEFDPVQEMIRQALASAKGQSAANADSTAGPAANSSQDPQTFGERIGAKTAAATPRPAAQQPEPVRVVMQPRPTIAPPGATGVLVPAAPDSTTRPSFGAQIGAKSPVAAIQPAQPQAPSPSSVAPFSAPPAAATDKFGGTSSESMRPVLSAPVGSNNPKLVDLLAQQAKAGKTIDKNAVDPNTGKPMYKMGWGERVLGTVSNFLTGFGGKGGDPIYVGPGATNRRYQDAEDTQQKTLKDLGTQITGQEKLDTTNLNYEKEAQRQAYQESIAKSRGETAEANLGRAQAAQDTVDLKQQIADLKAQQGPAEPKTETEIALAYQMAVMKRDPKAAVVLIRKMFAACEDFWGAWLGSNGCELSCGRGELGKGGS